MSLRDKMYVIESVSNGCNGKTGTLKSTYTALLLPLWGWAISNSSGKLLIVFAPKYNILCPVSYLVVLARLVNPFFDKPSIIF